MSRLENLSHQLFAAIDKNDLNAILRLKADGAQADYLAQREDDDYEITPIFHAIATGRAHLIEPLIGRGWKTVPLAMLLPRGMGEYDLYEAIVERCSDFMFSESVEALTNCLDVETPAVAHAMWNATLKALDPVSDAQFPTRAALDCAKTILWEGGYAPQPGAYAALLGARIGVGFSNSPLMFLDELGPACEHMYKRWFAHGLSPDTRVADIPLLHHFAISDWSELVAMALDGGADPDATCSYDVFNKNLPADDRRNEIQVGQPVSALDAARETDSPQTIQVLEAARAKRMIEIVLSTVRTGTKP